MALSTRASKLVHIALPLAWLLSSAAVGAAALTVSVDDSNGSLVASVGGAKAVSSTFVFWGKNWAWANLQSEFRVVAPFEYSISGQNQKLDFALAGRIKRLSDQQMIWELDFDNHSTKSDVIGGGISFKFDLANFGSQFGEPELLPGNRGWRWGRPGSGQIEMRFDPPLPSIHFERGHKSEIRAYFYNGEMIRGRQRFAATLNLSGEVLIGPTVAERFGMDDFTKWPTDLLNGRVVPWNVAPVDLSFLNAPEKPAGKRGFLKVVKDKLIFDDGTPARFWGTTLTAYALFRTPHDQVRLQARRLSELGFNLVRFTHHDSPWVSPNIFGDRSSPDTEHLNADMLQSLDWWIKCLKDEGIYIWLDLHAQRNFKKGDNIEGFDEIRKGQPTADLKGYNYVNAGIQQAMQRFNEAYLDHLNAYTGIRYKDDPAVIAIQLTNENDLTHHFGNALLPDKKVPWHNSLYTAQADAFAAKFQLPKDKVWRSWEHGPSKLFLNDLEHRFDMQQIHQLRALGLKAPIVTTNSWGDDPLSSLPALTAGNMIDVHSYGGAGELEKNPVYGANLVHWMAAAHVIDRPLSVSEWNVSPFPTPDRHALPLYIASSADFQSWDALMQYAYSQQPLSNGGSPSNWHSFNDPALLATLPAAALLYRRHDVEEAHTVYVFAPSRDQLFNQAISPATSVALRTAAERGKLMIALPEVDELPWLEKSRIPAGAKLINDPNLLLIDSSAQEVVSDTGQLRRNWENGTYTIDTPRTQAAMGWIGGKLVSLADVDIAVTTRNATVAVQSLDGEPISEARTIMISLGARSVPKLPGRFPFYSEPVTGRLTIHASAGLKLYKRIGIARREQQVPSYYENDRYQITLGQDLDTYWLVLK
jgi:hypothetical protein